MTKNKRFINVIDNPINNNNNNNLGDTMENDDKNTRSLYDLPIGFIDYVILGVSRSIAVNLGFKDNAIDSLFKFSDDLKDNPELAMRFLSRYQPNSEKKAVAYFLNPLYSSKLDIALSHTSDFSDQLRKNPAEAQEYLNKHSPKTLHDLIEKTLNRKYKSKLIIAKDIAKKYSLNQDKK